MKLIEFKTSKKGEYAEELVKQYLHSKEFFTFENSTKDAVSHPFDFIIYRKRNNVWELTAVDVKAKPRMSKFNGTGIDNADYISYKYLQEHYNMNVYLYFVDEELGKIYSNYLNELDREVIDGEQKYPFTIKTKFDIELRIFSMDNTIVDRKLTQKEIDILVSLTDQKYVRPHIYTEEEKIKRLQELKNLRNDQNKA